jgi:hypothetical protein
MGFGDTMPSKQPSSLEQKWREEKLALMERQIAEGSLVVRRLSKQELADYTPAPPKSNRAA